MFLNNLVKQDFFLKENPCHRSSMFISNSDNRKLTNSILIDLISDFFAIDAFNCIRTQLLI